MCTARPVSTGKTTYVARQLAQAEADGRDPFVASFTKAAAAEIADRASLPEERVGTLHAMCYALLDRPEIAEEHAHKEFEAYTVSRQSRGGLDDADGPANVADGDALLAEYNTQRQRLVPLDEMPARVRLFASHWEAWKREADYLDFTDLIRMVYDAGLPPPGRLGFFDEAQDMTPLDFALARQWGEHYLDDVVFVGDEDQVIYEWRGATPDGLLEPPLPPEHVRVLGQSWRLPRAVHAYAQRWIAQVARRADKPFTPREEEGSVEAAPHIRDVRALADMLEAHPEGETAIALASNHYVLQPLRDELVRRGVLFHHPWRRQHTGWNPLGGAQGGGTRARLLRMLGPNPDVHGEHAQPWTYGDLAAFLELFNISGVTRRGMAASVKKQPPDMVASAPALEALFLDDVLLEIELAPLDFARKHAKKGRRGVLDYLARVADRHGLAALAEPRPRITIGTIHSLKGGEGDHVYVMPDLSRAAADERSRTLEGRDATTRLFYVAFTRSRRTLTLLGSGSPRAVRFLPVS